MESSGGETILSCPSLLTSKHFMRHQTGPKFAPRRFPLLLRLTLGVRAALWDEVFQVPLDPLLHPSRWRLRALGLCLALGHPVFGWVWGNWLVQPYENGWLRLLMGLLGLVLVIDGVNGDPTSKLTQRVGIVVCWVEFPLFFGWMYFCNHGNAVWLASLCAMILIYYHLTDWRIATLGTFTGILAAWLASVSLAPEGHAVDQQALQVNGMVVAFSWFCALLLGLSSANLRREQLKQTLVTMGIMAHELRTPLATISLVGDALRSEAHSDASKDFRAPQNLGKLAVRLHALVRQMNHQIDTQITNARLLKLPATRESVVAGQLVNEVVHSYPYRSTRERECVQTVIRRDFLFLASRPLCAQVIDNLLKNALHALAARGDAPKVGDIQIEVGILHGRGRIVVTDNGKGIDPALLPRIFEPFFSSDHRTGHGLGLAFCRRVVQSAGGSIRVSSQSGHGATFTVDLPTFQ